MTYTTCLLDIDNTLLDFKAAETIALEKLFAELGVPHNEQTIERYEAVNRKLWHDHEEGLISQQTIRDERFKKSLEAFNLPYTGFEMDEMFRRHIEDNNVYIDGAKELITALVGKARLMIATNGITETQYRRLDNAMWTEFFEHIFISEKIGYAKPQIEFYNYAFDQIENFDPKKTIMLGDNVKADIMGAMNAGIDACWYNPEGLKLPSSINPTYEIKQLSEFIAIVLE